MGAGVLDREGGVLLWGAGAAQRCSMRAHLPARVVVTPLALALELPPRVAHLHEGYTVAELLDCIDRVGVARVQAIADRSYLHHACAYKIMKQYCASSFEFWILY